MQTCPAFDTENECWTREGGLRYYWDLASITAYNVFRHFRNHRPGTHGGPIPKALFNIQESFQNSLRHSDDFYYLPTEDSCCKSFIFSIMWLALSESEPPAWSDPEFSRFWLFTIPCMANKKSNEKPVSLLFVSKRELSTKATVNT